MHMSFWWDSKVDHFLFYGYNITTIGGLVATCFGAASLAFLFEWFKLLQAQHRQRQLIFRAKQLRNICPPEHTRLLDSARLENFRVTAKNRFGLPCFDAFLWLFSYDLGYLLMLTVMFYHGWIFISVILGSGIGYFIFGQTFMKINLQNCHLIRNTFCANNCRDPEFCGSKNGESTPVLAASSSNTITNDQPSITVEVHNSSSDDNE